MSLSKFEGNGQRALLTFTAELSDRPAVQQQLQFVSVRANHGHAMSPLASVSLREFDSKVLFHTWMILEAQFLRTSSNASIRLRGERAQLGDQFGAQPDDLMAGADQFARETHSRPLIK